MWKSNWEDTKKRFNKWWNREGVMLGMWGAPNEGRSLHESVVEPTRPATMEERYCNARYRAEYNHWLLSRSSFPADVLPMASTDIGPGSLSLFCGSKPGLEENTVWFFPCIEEVENPESLPPIVFDENNSWWKITDAIMKSCAAKAQGKYVVGCPDLMENIDILASLRGAQTLLIDMLERPEWVEAKVREINQVFFETYSRIQKTIMLPDGSASYGAFYLWGPGRVAKVQCDASAMFSTDMYRQFVLPALSEQCDWLDHSLYHLDGTQAVHHVDALLEIKGLDAIEWTPQAGIETGGHKRWYPLYKKILEGGKSVQVVNVEHDEIRPLLDAIGRDGVYILTNIRSEDEGKRLMDLLG